LFGDFFLVVDGDDGVEEALHQNHIGIARGFPSSSIKPFDAD
jgi:hypothetical protein